MRLFTACAAVKSASAVLTVVMAKRVAGIIGMQMGLMPCDYFHDGPVLLSVVPIMPSVSFRPNGTVFLRALVLPYQCVT